MREEKKYISRDYLERLNASPFFITVDFNRITVSEFADMRGKLAAKGAEIHVVKNNIFAIAAEEAGISGLKSQLAGQVAVATGANDVSGTAKVLKDFHKDTEKGRMLFGYMDSDRLESDELMALADLPPLEVLRGQLLGVIQAPATKLVQVLNAPGSQLAQVLKAKADKDS